LTTLISWLILSRLCTERLLVCKEDIKTHPPSPTITSSEERQNKSIRQLLEEEIAWLTDREKQLSERLNTLKQESQAFMEDLRKKMQ
jgi:hypothetical protein